MSKTDIKTCRYAKCLHDHKIDITVDDYVLVGKMSYYHADCLQIKQQELKVCEEEKEKRKQEQIQKRKEQEIEKVNRQKLILKKREARKLEEERQRKERERRKKVIENKDEKTKTDFQYIKNGWVEHISETVVFYQLFNCLNDLLCRGISSDYMVFVFDYVVQHHMKLRYPQGFKYYIDNQEIKDAYQKSKMPKYKNSMFSVKEENFEEPEDTISQIPIQTPKGFGSIFKKKG